MNDSKLIMALCEIIDRQNIIIRVQALFTAFLGYKLADRGKRIIKIDKWYPSSKTCHICGAINDLYCTGDGTADGKTPEALRQELAVVLDRAGLL